MKAPAVSVSPPINFILYVPDKSKSPLYILYENGTLLHLTLKNDLANKNKN
jgi:hypothetical protein